MRIDTSLASAALPSPALDINVSLICVDLTRNVEINVNTATRWPYIQFEHEFETAIWNKHRNTTFPLMESICTLF